MTIIVTNSSQPIGDDREPNSIHPIRLQIVSTGLIGTLKQIGQFENIKYHLLRCGR